MRTPLGAVNQSQQVKRGVNSQMTNLGPSNLDDSPGHSMNARPGPNGSSMSRRNKTKFSANFQSSEMPLSTQAVQKKNSFGFNNNLI